MPAALLIHGGGNGLDLIQNWKNFAEHNNIILVGHTVHLGEIFETATAPYLYPLTMDALSAEWNRCSSNLRLCSAGWLFDVGMFDPQYFADGKVFAAVMTSDFNWIVHRATPKIPIALYIRYHDGFFTVAHVQRTSNLLALNGFPVRMIISPNLDHNYCGVADIVTAGWLIPNADVWNFFSQASPP